MGQVTDAAVVGPWVSPWGKRHQCYMTLSHVMCHITLTTLSPCQKGDICVLAQAQATTLQRTDSHEPAFDYYHPATGL